MNNGFKFVNGVECNLKHPVTFKIPSDEEKANLSDGNYVKVGFDGNDTIERMWLYIDSVDHETKTINGTLDNEPIVYHGLIKHGDKFTVYFDHVLAIL